MLVFGYPSQPAQVGGLLWSKRVSDLIKEKGVVQIINRSSDRSIEKKLDTKAICRQIIPSLIDDLHDALAGFITRPDIVLLDSWGEANVILWLLLRFLKPNTRIITVFHHYEPRTSPTVLSHFKSKTARKIAASYGAIIEKLTQLMIRNSDCIITVSRTSLEQLCMLYGIDESNKKHKVRIVGAGIDQFEIQKSLPKDIDFLCVGRIEKLEGIDRIWQLIKEQHPSASFVMIGRASKEDVARLKSLGVEHRGIVSDEEKIQLYSRSKVFLFPSVREGFGISLAEAVYAGMTAVTWNLPVFNELYANNHSVKLVPLGDHDMYAKKAIESLSPIPEEEILSSSKGTAAATASVLKTKMINETESISSWPAVAKKVLDIVIELLPPHNNNDDNNGISTLT